VIEGRQVKYRSSNIGAQSGKYPQANIWLTASRDGGVSPSSRKKVYFIVSPRKFQTVGTEFQAQQGFKTTPGIHLPVQVSL
jgi:hypothetical protein